MEEIAKMQGEKKAIVILETEDGGTTYLRYKITQEEAKNILSEAYNNVA